MHNGNSTDNNITDIVIDARSQRCALSKIKALAKKELHNKRVVDEKFGINMCLYLYLYNDETAEPFHLDFFIKDSFGFENETDASEAISISLSNRKG
jgi:hypothetical protein